MANNRMFLVCRKCKSKKNGSLWLAKFFPSGGYICGDGAGWFTSHKKGDALNNFFEEHKHDFDKSLFGGWQYCIRYEVVKRKTSKDVKYQKRVKKNILND